MHATLKEQAQIKKLLGSLKQSVSDFTEEVADHRIQVMELRQALTRLVASVTDLERQIITFPFTISSESGSVSLLQPPKEAQSKRPRPNRQ